MRTAHIYASPEPIYWITDHEERTLKAFNESDRLQVKLYSFKTHVEGYFTKVSKYPYPTHAVADRVDLYQETLSDLLLQLIELDREYYASIQYTDNNSQHRTTAQLITRTRLDKSDEIIAHLYTMCENTLCDLGISDKGYSVGNRFREILYRIDDFEIPFRIKIYQVFLASVDDVIETMETLDTTIMDMSKLMVDCVALSKDITGNSHMDTVLRGIAGRADITRAEAMKEFSRIKNAIEDSGQSIDKRKLKVPKTKPIPFGSDNTKESGVYHFGYKERIALVVCAVLMGIGLSLTKISFVTVVGLLVLILLAGKVFNVSLESLVQSYMAFTGIGEFGIKKSHSVDIKEIDLTESKAKLGLLTSPHILKIGKQVFTAVDKIEMPYDDNSVIYVDDQTWIKAPNGRYELVVDDLGENDVDADIRYIPSQDNQQQQANI